VILFIDDVNMPAYDNYGTQMPIELLRQFLDFQGLYDREYLEWKKISDTTLICAAAPPEGGRKVLSKRFTRHFHMICLPPTQEESL
jgi:dynein heavy chain, axonemal